MYVIHIVFFLARLMRKNKDDW